MVRRSWVIEGGLSDQVSGERKREFELVVRLECRNDVAHLGAGCDACELPMVVVVRWLVDGDVRKNAIVIVTNHKSERHRDL